MGFYFTNSSLSNSGTITGGNGGLGGVANGGTAGAIGQGGTGIAGQGLTITNTGTISGGLAGDGATRADAIDFTGGTNSLTLGNTTTQGTLNGGIGVGGTLSVDPGTGAGTSRTLANQIQDYNGVSGSLNKTGAGTLSLTGANTYTGGTTISGGTLDLNASPGYTNGAVSSGAAGTGAITFASLSGSATARLVVETSAQPPTGGTFSNTLNNFNANSQLDLTGLTNSQVSYNSTNSSITVTGTRGNGQVSENFVLNAPRATNFVAQSDGAGGTRITVGNQSPTQPTNPTPPGNNAPCYVTGTRILTDRGDIAVEALAVGDVAVTASGEHRPIRWIGSRTYPGLSIPQHDRPVRIKAGALGDGVPARDLRVSPDHALMVAGVFVAAGHLVNGTSITRGEAVADLTYWHVELDSHDLLMAENTPAESFLAAAGVRAGFDGVQTLDAGAAPVPYAPRAELGPELAALRGRLAHRAISPDALVGLGPVRAWLDRCLIGADGLLHVGGWAQDPAQPDDVPVCLDVMVDGVVVAFTVASQYRADLAAAGVGDGRVGFDLGVDVRLAPGTLHVIEVRRSADRVLVCAKQVDAAGAWTALLAA